VEFYVPRNLTLGVSLLSYLTWSVLYVITTSCQVIDIGHGALVFNLE